MDEDEAFNKEIAMNSAAQFGNRGYAAPMEQHSGTILILTNPSDVLFQLELSLRNVREDENGLIMPNGDPLLNDLGVASVLGQVRSIVNQTTNMSNLEHTQVMALVDYLGDTLARDLMMSQTKYEIKNGYDRDKIYFQSLTTAFITMRRAVDEGERRFWRGSQQEITTRIEGANRGGKGFFNKVLTGGFK